MPKCKVCHRELKNPASIAAGIGPVCAKRFGAFKATVKRQHEANFEIVTEQPDLMIIRDVGPWDIFPTITNDAEGVVARLAEKLCGRRLLYYDSLNMLDELLVRDGKFAGFAPGPTRRST